MGFIKITIIDVIDILLVAYIMYYVYKLIRGTNATSILTGIVLIYGSWVLARALNMEMMSGVLGDVVSVGLIALIVIFQSEIRKFLQTIGDRGQAGPVGALIRMLSIGGKGPKQQGKNAMESCIEPVVRACVDMSNSLTGALIVIQQQGDIKDVISTGTRVDAIVSDSLVKNIFFKNSPLHDGAMVIGGGRIVAAGCVLPSTKNEVPKSFGMRHRAAMGLTEESDAVIIVVSEETGRISVAHLGKIRTGLSGAELKAELLRISQVASAQEAQAAQSSPTEPAQQEK